MFQSFDTLANPEQGPNRLAELRGEILNRGLHGFLVPRADAHQGEYVAPRDDRLKWLTGFTGSAGFCAVLQEKAGVFVDGRYRVQVREQVTECFTPVDWPEKTLGPWLRKQLNGGCIGFDPWLYTVGQITEIEDSLRDSGITLVPTENLIDKIWSDQPSYPIEPVYAQPIKFAGETHSDKRARLGRELTAKGHESAVITLPDSIAWLLNIRGNDIPRNPVAHGFAVLFADGTVDLFMDPSKLVKVTNHLGEAVRIIKPDQFLARLRDLKGPVRLNKASVPVIVQQALEGAQRDIAWGAEPCILPKARKNTSEVAGMVSAHLRDSVAITRFLCWFDSNFENGITEIDVVMKLEEYRRASGSLLDISFDTIAGSGPHGAIMHYRVTRETNRKLQSGDLLVLDSGGQYQDGTTDITRTLPVGKLGKDEQYAFTRVLQGMIAMSRLRWPTGLTGSHIESIGRAPLWMAGQDFDHGLGHGVGAYLCVHEGPQRLSRVSDVPLECGMILSNEPGYYRNGAFGIRIENLIVVEEAPTLSGGDEHRNMLRFKTLTYAPIDRRLIIVEQLTAEELNWLDEYHATCRKMIAPSVDTDTRLWLDAATAPL